ncbi:MAG: aldo/keto reductase [Clostridiales bacterium]|jgi:predicted aldo/keto reductase-like oxidoreductase|nr:aldo/keto reductase [Clostridiales bacterium]
MKYTNFKDEKLSLLGMGAMRLPQKGEGWGMPIIHDEAEALIDFCLEQGINYFDTAYIYHGGESEVLLGNALKKHPRDSFYVADKYSMNAEPDYKLQFETQLKRLQMDRIDFYLLHAVQDTTVDQYLTNGCIEYFLEQRAAGRIKYLGFSFHGSPEALVKMTNHRDWDFVLMQLNYLDWFHNNAKELYEHLRSKNIPVMVMEPIHGGLLAKLNDEAAAPLLEAAPEKSLASWALRFVANLPGIAVVLSGMSNQEQAEDNLATIKALAPLTSDEEALIIKAADIFNKTIGATCTDCKYCVEHCPQGLNIPYLLHTYNSSKTGGIWRLNRLKALPEDKQPAACISCNVCMKYCPQNLEIPKFMDEMAENLKA